MSDIILKNTLVAVEKENSEGTEVLPQGATSFILAMEDGANDIIKPAREALERANLNATLDKSASRGGMKSVSGSMGVEFKSGGSSSQPEYGVLFESALGSHEAGSLDNVTSALNFNFATTDVNDTDNEITHALHGLETGLTVQFSSTTTLPGGLSALTDYWVVKTGVNTFKLSDSLAHAKAATNIIDITDVGVGTHTCTPKAHTSTVIYMGETSAFSVGDTVLIKESGAYHCSPITALTEDVSITLLVPKATSVFTKDVKVDVLRKYSAQQSGHPSFSVTKYLESALRETGFGCKISAMDMSDWTTGKNPKLKFSYEGMGFTRTTNAPSFTPSYQAQLPVISLNACIYKDGVNVQMDSFTMTLKNTVEFKTSTCSPNGRLSSRATAREITGKLNPYKQSDSFADFTKWYNDTTFSLFAWAGNPTAVSGEYNEIISIYLPACQFTEIGQTDKNGLLQDDLPFAARSSTLPTMTVCVG
jgi:hypothetical protein